MKTRIIFGIGLVIAMSSSTWADGPLDPVQLGTFDGMFNVCREINPAGIQAYDTMREAMLGEQPKGAIEAVTKTPEYRQAYDAARQKSAEQPHDQVLKECTQLAAALTPHAPQGKRHK
jgi:hypothetical protein